MQQKFGEKGFAVCGAEGCVRCIELRRLLRKGVDCGRQRLPAHVLVELARHVDLAEYLLPGRERRRASGHAVQIARQLLRPGRLAPQHSMDQRPRLSVEHRTPVLFGVKRRVAIDGHQLFHLERRRVLDAPQMVREGPPVYSSRPSFPSSYVL